MPSRQLRDLADESAREDVARYVRASPEQHAEDLAAVCRMVEATLMSRQDPQAALAYQDPRSREAEALWLERFLRSPLARKRPHGGPER